MHRFHEQKIRKFFFLISVICMIAFFIPYEEPGFERLSYEKPADSCSIRLVSSPIAELRAVTHDEYSRSAVVKNNVSESRDSGKESSSRGQITVIAGIPWVFVCIYTLFFLFFCKTIVTHHRFIITYIHDLDGMKP